MHYVLIVSLFSAGAAFAQTKTTRPLIEQLFESSVQDAKLISAQLEVEAKKGNGFDPCTADLLNLQLTYDQWFTKNATQFAAMQASVQKSLQDANSKLAQLQDSRVDINAVEGQSSNVVSVSLPQLIAYFKNLNERLKGISDEKLSILMETQNNPALNSLKISHGQAITAMKLMTINLNTSLKEQQSTYEVGFTPTPRHFSLEFRVSIQVESKTLHLDLSLLNSEQLTLALTEKEIWNRLSRENMQIAGFPVDARARYRAFRDAHSNKKCVELEKIVFPGTSMGVPFATYTDASAGSIFANSRFWSLVPGPATVVATQVVVSPQGSIYLLGSPDAGGLRRVYTRSFASPEWTEVTHGAIKQIAVGTFEEIYAVGNNGNVYRKNKSEKSWSYYAGKNCLNQVAIDPAGAAHVLVSEMQMGPAKVKQCSYVLPSSTKVKSFIALPGRYIILNEKKEILQGTVDGRWDAKALSNPTSPAIQIAASSEDIFLALAEDGSTYSYSDGYWTLVAESNDSHAKIISISVNAQHQIAGMDSKGRVYLLKEKTQ